MVTSFLFSLNYKKVRYKAGGATGLHDVRVSLVWPVSVTSTCGYEFGFLWNKDSLIYIILIIQMFLKWNVVSTSVHRWIRYELRESCKCEFCIICGDFSAFVFIFGFVCIVDFLSFLKVLGLRWIGVSEHWLEMECLLLMISNFFSRLNKFKFVKVLLLTSYS